MTARTIQSKAKKYMALQAKAAEIEKQMDAIKADLKAEMDELNTDTMQAGNILIRWTRFISYRFDSRRFKAEHGALYADYARPMESMRFTVAER